MKIPGQRNRVCCFVDDLNLPDNCDLSLMPVEIIARSVVPMMQTQYRLRLAEGYEPLVSIAMFKFLIAHKFVLKESMPTEPKRMILVGKLLELIFSTSSLPVFVVHTTFK